ncbi:MAG: redoxin domain-containing protein, partial [Pirellula sp.]|nr:redoxin domain-containing protein [Pirellula sp.]
PRHPKYNTFDNRGSTFYGRERLLQTLVQYERWEELLRITETYYLPEEADVHRNDERLAWRAIAACYTGKSEIAQESKGKLEASFKDLEGEEAKKIESLEKSKNDPATTQIAGTEPASATPNSEPSVPEAGAPETAKDSSQRVPEHMSEPALVPTALELFGKSDDPALPKELSKDWNTPDGDEAKNWSEERKNAERELHNVRYRKQRLAYWLAALASQQAAAKGDFRDALRHSHQARPIVSEWTRIEWLALCGDPSEAWKIAEAKLNDSPGEILPLARGAWLLCMQPEKSEKLQEVVEKLKPLAARAEQGIAAVDRLKSLLVEKGIVVDWNFRVKEPSDVGERPNLDTLGPFRWAPSNAPIWHAINSESKLVTSKQYAGKPYIAILYLGSGCLHCVEQLSLISPKIQDFKNLGIELVAISTEDVDQLRMGIANFDKPIHTPLLTNVEQDTFKGFRAYDDFEGQPLHGTFLVDAKGRILWQDIGHEPFMEIDFLIQESERLLRIGESGDDR